jgi:hypothetical protein
MNCSAPYWPNHWRCDTTHLIRSQFSGHTLKLANLGNAQKCESPLAKGGFQGKGNTPPNQFAVTAPTIAPQAGGVQHSRISTSANVHERRRTIQSLPVAWRKALLAFDGQKRPICPASGRLLADWPNASPPSFEQLLRAPAVGLRTGSSSGTLAFDFDGPESWKTFRRIFGDQPWNVLPPSISWTSSRKGRRQVGFFVAPEHHHLLENKRRKIDDLEFRWENAASVICGAHPLTNGYKWIDGCAPWEQSLATLPLEIIEKIPENKNAPEKPIGNYQPIVYDLVVPLEAFVTYASSVLIKNGSNEGCCNDDAIRLSMDLVAAENWLMAQKVGVDRTAQDLFDEYVGNCPDRINGKPLNIKAMQNRFDGAVRLQPTPPTPEPKLIERLNYQKRQAAKNARGAA